MKVIGWGLWSVIGHTWDGSSLLGHLQRYVSLTQVFLTLIKSIVKIKTHTMAYTKVQREQ